MLIDPPPSFSCTADCGTLLGPGAATPLWRSKTSIVLLWEVSTVPPLYFPCCGRSQGCLTLSPSQCPPSRRFLRRFGFEKHHEEGEEPTGCCGRRKATAGGNKEQRLLDQRSASPTTSMYPYMATDNAGPEEEDSDVRRERERVLAMATDVENGRGEQSRYPVLIKHLRKSFGIRGEAPKVAVGDLCLSISKGECFGLLGVNGGLGCCCRYLISLCVNHLLC